MHGSIESRYYSVLFILLVQVLVPIVECLSDVRLFNSGFLEVQLQTYHFLERKITNWMCIACPIGQIILLYVEPSYPDNRTIKWSFGQVEKATITRTYKINEAGSETMIVFLPKDLWYLTKIFKL